MSIFKTISLKFPNLRDKLKSAGIYKKPEEYIKESVTSSFGVAFFLTILMVFFFSKMGLSPLLAVPFFFVTFLLLLTLFVKRVDAAISRREREIDKDVLFAGRFLLVKLNSGKPLINSIVDASKSYGVAQSFFKEIVDDIDLGTPMEDALLNAYRVTPSKRFRKILFQINNAIKIGVDVTAPLEAILDEISQEQLIEIQRYGKKLSSLTMFYMLLAIVLPSLGITLFSVVASMISIKVDLQMFLVILFFIMLIQVVFLSLFRSIRPNLNI